MLTFDSSRSTSFLPQTDFTAGLKDGFEKVTTGSGLGGDDVRLGGIDLAQLLDDLEITHRLPPPPRPPAPPLPQHGPP